MIQAGLVLEGGGMKGIYTAGVLEYFMEKELYFQNCYGVSAGACHLCSYISKQPKRAYRISLDYLKDENYCSTKSLLTTGDLFNVKMCYDTIPNKLDPYDYKMAAKYEGNAYAVATNVETGQAEYLPMKEMHRDIIHVRASASLPLVSRFVSIHGHDYLDGGLADMIPLKHAMEDGNQKNVVVLTKEVGYVRKPTSHPEMFKFRYPKHPKIYELMRDRHLIYQDTMHLIEKEENAGNVFVIRPQEPNDIGRIEKDREKLEKLYWIGYEDARRRYEDLMNFLKKDE